MITPDIGVTKSRKAVSVGLALGFSVVFLYLTFRKIDGRELLRAMGLVSLPILSLSLLTKFCGFLVMSWRSRILLKPVRPYPYYRLFKSVLVAFAGNNVLPARMGEILRVAYLARYGKVAPSSCLAVVVFERLLDLFCLLLLFACIWPLFMADLTVSGAIYAVAFVIIIGVGCALALSRHPDFFVGLAERVCRLLGQRLSAFVTTKVERFAEGLSALRSTASVLVVFLLSATYWATMMASILIWIKAFGLSLPWYAPFLIVVFTSFGAALPSSPAFVGTYHYFAAAALSLLGVERIVAVSVAVVGHAIAILPFTLASVVLLLPDFTGRDALTFRVARAESIDAEIR